MSEDLIERLLAGRLPDPDGNGRLTVETRRVVIGTGLAGSAPALLRELGLPAPLAIVTDPATRAAIGGQLIATLAAPYRIIEVPLPANPRPDEDTVDRVVAASQGAGSLLAVGSGTINDVTKLAAARGRRPWAVFGTALSMNGYASPNAAITVGGHKKTLPAVPALGIYLDLDVLAAAPARLTRAGLGDSLCRPTAQADWLLSHLLLGTAYRSAPFALLEADESALLADPAALLRGDRPALAALARTLILSGFGMAICGGSWPASQAEHLVSHWLEMRADGEAPTALHGLQIGVATLAIAALQSAIFAGPAPRLMAEPLDQGELAGRYGPALGAGCWAEIARKRLDAPEAAALSARLAPEWTAIAARCQAVGRPVGQLRTALIRAGAPVTPAAIGVARPTWRAALRHAREIRDRFTILDLAALSGRLDHLIGA